MVHLLESFPLNQDDLQGAEQNHNTSYQWLPVQEWFVDAGRSKDANASEHVFRSNLKHCLLRTLLTTGDVEDVTAYELYCLRIFRVLILSTVSLPTRPSGEQPRNGNLGQPKTLMGTLSHLWYFRTSWLLLVHIQEPNAFSNSENLKRAEAPFVSENKFLCLHSYIWLRLTDKFSNFKSRNTRWCGQSTPSFWKPFFRFTLHLCSLNFQKGL